MPTFILTCKRCGLQGIGRSKVSERNDQWLCPDCAPPKPGQEAARLLAKKPSAGQRKAR